MSDSASGARGSIVRIDPGTGAQTLVSAGGELFCPTGLSLLPDGDFLVAGTGFGGAGDGVILRVDASTGEQEIIAKPTLSFAWAAVATPEGEAYFTTVLPGLVARVAVATGEQTLVAEVGNATALALEPRGTLVAGVILSDFRNAQIVRVDPVTGGTEDVATFPGFVTGLAVVPVRVLEVEIDVRPESASNPVNLAAQGVVPVALLGSEDLDVEEIDRASLAFGPGGAPPARAGTLADLNGDGRLDLLLHFSISATGIQAGDTEACLGGSTLESRRIEG